MCVLLIEDEFNIIEVINFILFCEGYDVVIYVNGYDVMDVV